MPIDFDFISKLEGGSRLKGYVPQDEIGGVESGPTVASGFDLGQWSARDMRKAGVPAPLIKKLLPFVGVRGVKAKALLNQMPLNISKGEAQQLNTAAHGRTVKSVARQFNADSKRPFHSLPAEMQTVVGSIAHQYGTNLKNRTPRFWEQMTTGKFDKALGNLRNFGDSYGTRRNKEADLFEQAIVNGVVPKDPVGGLLGSHEPTVDATQQSLIGKLLGF